MNRASVNLHTDFKLELGLKTAEVKRLTALLAKFASLVDSNGKISSQNMLTRQSSSAASAAKKEGADIVGEGRGGQIAASSPVGDSQSRPVTDSPSPHASGLLRSYSDKGLQSNSGLAHMHKASAQCPEGQQLATQGSGSGQLDHNLTGALCVSLGVAHPYCKCCSVFGNACFVCGEH